MQLIDTHAHLNMKDFDGEVSEVLHRAAECGVSTIINVGFDRLSSEKSLELSEKYEQIYAVIGFHPHDAAKITSEDLTWLEENLSHPKVVALGEIGLDYHYDYSPRPVQRDFFIRQLEIALRMGKKVVVHSREACQETFDILENFNLPVVLHCYSGSLELALEHVSRNRLISLGGAVTFRNARKPLEVAAGIGCSSLMLETDSPYMTPVPFRGQRNEPAHLIKIAEKLSDILSITLEELAAKTTDNARRFFNLQES
ncbi:MAG: TatD family hydrolase [Candidatus Wallbacteria bacterium]|nr:TatD family hydrolase [Candidatus Wallbacteria bacterium]